MSPRDRATWDQYFMQIAREVATRATCDRKHVGAVIVRDKNILATGYNGSIRGLGHCDEEGHMMEDGHCVRTIHAEANAIIQAAKNGNRIEGASIYVSASPCWGCFKMIANAGLSKIVYGEFYRDQRIFEFAQRLGIELVKVELGGGREVTGGPLGVVVVEGGPSAEAAVSRSSAEGVAGALAAAGHRVTRLALDASLAHSLATRRPDVVFPVVHGTFGEDGCLQGLLELLALPYVGSGVLASALASDKIAAKVMFRGQGLPVAEQSVVARGEDLARAAARVRGELGPAIVVKPHAQGSAIGVTRIDRNASDRDLAKALELALSFDDRALCERFVVGREVTCGVLDAAAIGAARALPPTEIVSKVADFYDFRSRYGTGASEHVCPARLDPAVVVAVQEVALGAHRALGCRDLSRADFVVGDGDDPGRVTLLEVNTIPGMTPTSLFPEAARATGIEMAALCDGLVRSAHRRGARARNEPVPLPP